MAQTIAELRRTYGVEESYASPDGLVAVWHKETGYYHWYRHDAKTGRYLSTGSTRTLDDDAVAVR